VLRAVPCEHDDRDEGPARRTGVGPEPADALDDLGLGSSGAVAVGLGRARARRPAAVSPERTRCPARDSKDRPSDGRDGRSGAQRETHGGASLEPLVAALQLLDLGFEDADAVRSGGELCRHRASFVARCAGFAGGLRLLGRGVHLDAYLVEECGAA
jgi:hypothetical protein